MARKKLKDYQVRGCRLACRVNNAELNTVIKKAIYYTGGDVSKFLRYAALKFNLPKSELAAE